MRTALQFSATLAILLVASICTAAEHDDQGLFLPDKVNWGDGPPSIPPGAKMAILEGDPTKDGPFVMRCACPTATKSQHTRTLKLNA